MKKFEEWMKSYYIDHGFISSDAEMEAACNASAENSAEEIAKRDARIAARNIEVIEANHRIREQAERIAELEFSWAGCSQQLKDACADLDAVEKQRDELTKANETHRELARISRDNELKANLIANEQAAEISRLNGVIAKCEDAFERIGDTAPNEGSHQYMALEALAAIKEIDHA